MAQGDSWEIAVATPVKNNKFIYGKNYSGVLSQEIAAANTSQFYYSHALYPELIDILQYQDAILLGPSSKSAYRGESEHIQVTGIEKWNPGVEHKIWSRFRNNVNQYNAGDPITIYGSGLGGGWEIPSYMKSYIQAEGIRTGPISKQKVVYYTGGSIVINEIDGKYWVEIPIGQTSANDFRFGLDLAGDFFEYVKTPISNAGIMEFGIDDSGPSDFYVLLGDWHRGGWRKEFAQRLSIEIKKDMGSGSIFQQSLLTYGSAGNLGEKSLLIPYQYYRFGGKVYFDTSKLREIDFLENFNMLMILRQHGYHREDGEYLWTYMATTASEANKWLDFSTVNLLKSGVSNISAPTVSLWLENNSIGDGDAHPTGYSYGNIHLYVDELWVEHAGGVNYADTDGCLDFGRYCVWPEQGSIELNEIEDVTTLNYKRKRLQIRCRFPMVSQTFWDQMEIILSWQQRGFSINIHPYLNDIPNVLTGKIAIRDLKKESWDLSTRSFTLEFTED